MPKVYLGVGHGGTDPGAVAGNFKEKDLNLNISLACKTELERHGVEVKISRTTDKNSTIDSKVKECNSFGADLCVEIHNNAGGGDGAEAYYHYKGGKSKTLAINVLAELMGIGQNSRGAKIKKNALGKDYFAMIRNTICPAILVECAFIDNITDVQIVDTPEEQKIIGKAIAKGILKTFGIDYKETEPIGHIENTKAKLYRVQVGAFAEKPNAEKLKNELESKGYSAIIVEV